MGPLLEWAVFGRVFQPLGAVKVSNLTWLARYAEPNSGDKNAAVARKHLVRPIVFGSLLLKDRPFDACVSGIAQMGYLMFEFLTEG
jgi:hypothetical protein